MHLTEDEQRRSPLARVLPRRKSGVKGVRPGVSSNPDNDEFWTFSRNSRTEFEERMIVAMAVQIGIIAVMNTHQYSFDGKTFLQEALSGCAQLAQLNSGDENMGHQMAGEAGGQWDQDKDWYQIHG